MALISSANLLAYTDKIGAVYKILRDRMGIRTGSAVAGTGRYLLEAMLAIPVNADDYELQTDLNAAAYNAVQNGAAEGLASFLQTCVSSINSHVRNRGASTDSSLTTLSAYLNYLNTSPTGTPWAAMVTPEFADLYYAVLNSRLPANHIQSPSISPLTDSTSYPNGLGYRAVGGSFTDGVAVSDSIYGEVEPLLVVTADFASGGAAPQIAVAATDNDGTASTWNITLDGNNPTSALSTTITPAVNAMARQTVAVASATGIVRGSVLTINSGLVDQEVVIVEAISGTDITAVFMNAHDAGAAVTHKRTYAITPPASGKRVRNVTNITITISSHSAGTVRIDGRRDRVGV